MSIKLEDEHLTKLAKHIAKFFVNELYTDKISPFSMINGFDETTRIFGGQVIEEAQEVWDQTGYSIKDPSKKRTIDDKLMLIKTADKSTPESKLNILLPEEKIIINKDVFRSIVVFEQ